MNDFLQNRPRHSPGLKTHAVSRVGLPSLQPEPATGIRECGGSTPRVDLVENDGRIDRIVVTCGCGETITLQCEY